MNINDAISILKTGFIIPIEEFKRNYIKEIKQLNKSLFEFIFINGFKINAVFSEKYNNWYFFINGKKVSREQLKIDVFYQTEKMAKLSRLYKLLSEISIIPYQEFRNKYLKGINQIDNDLFEIVFSNGFIIKAIYKSNKPMYDENEWKFIYKNNIINKTQLKLIFKSLLDKQLMPRKFEEVMNKIFNNKFEYFKEEFVKSIEVEDTYEFNIILIDDSIINATYKGEDEYNDNNWTFTYDNKKYNINNFDQTINNILISPSNILKKLILSHDFAYRNSDDASYYNKYKIIDDKINSQVNFMIKDGLSKIAKETWIKYAPKNIPFPNYTKENFENLIKECIINEIGEFNNLKKKYFVPDNVSINAKEALQKIKDGETIEYNKNEGSGLNKAAELANKKPQTQEQIKRLKAFFENNKNKKDIVWDLHGGDEGYNWVTQEINKTKASNLRRKKVIRFMGGAGTNKGLGSMDIKMMNTTKKRS